MRIFIIVSGPLIVAGILALVAKVLLAVINHVSELRELRLLLAAAAERDDLPAVLAAWRRGADPD